MYALVQFLFEISNHTNKNLSFALVTLQSYWDRNQLEQLGSQTVCTFVYYETVACISRLHLSSATVTATVQSSACSAGSGASCRQMDRHLKINSAVRLTKVKWISLT